MTPFLFPIRVTVRRYTTDEFGDRRVTAEFTVPGCSTVMRSGSSLTRSSWTSSDEFRQQVFTRLRLLAPSTADVRADDEVVLPGGEVFRVDGTPSAPTHPWTGWRPGVVAQLLRVTG
ncbi:hypothetical protein ACFQ16_03990 [Saccharopolyspora rosea]|uniref:Head-to-tail stopper n=1 Tax=Saccharopolyspora rosea TaxID=524884 RepID=A0ABW3FQ37_9PSEU